MNKFGFYFKMALSNIRKNGKFYIPFLLISSLSVAMFLNMYSFMDNDTLPGGNSFRTVMSFGVVVIAFFCAIFMFYTNSFLIKRRKKELGIYNILGMEKRHIAKVITWETLISAVISLGCGIGFGILFDRLLFMVLNKVIQFSVNLKYELHPNTIICTAILFAVVFVLILIKNIIEITKAKPVDLLSGGNVGEKEPKIKWPLAVIGVVSLLAGYIIAVTTTNAIQAITYFFIAVILVMIGTYCLFMAGSIAILKALKANKGFYYQSKHFASVSGMLYRMKQNAVGLANICILSTMVLVMISTTTSLYAGMNDIIDRRYPTDMCLTVRNADKETKDAIDNAVKATSEKLGLKTTDSKKFTDMMVSMGQKGTTFSTDMNDQSLSVCIFYFYTPESYKLCLGKDVPELKDGEIGVFEQNGKVGDKINLFGKDFNVRHIDGKVPSGSMSVFATSVYYVAVKNDAAFAEINNLQQRAYGEECSAPTYNYFFNVSGTDEDSIAFNNELKLELNSDDTGSAVLSKQKAGRPGINFDNRQEGQVDFQEFYGAFLFLGIFLGFLFLMDTVLIIYYKQLVEGYDDRTRFDIMQKVGMSRDEVQKSIKSQILIMFFLPLLTAVIHLCFAFPMLKHLLAALNLTNIPLFITCAVITVIVYAIVYAIVYKLTAKTYYNIVSE